MLLGLICPREIFTNLGKFGEADDLLTVWLTADGKKWVTVCLNLAEGVSESRKKNVKTFGPLI